MMIALVQKNDNRLSVNERSAYFSDHELNTLADLAEKKRWEWLMARLATKDLILRFLQKTPTQLKEIDIQVKKNSVGRPYLQIPSNISLDERPCLSISHSGDMAVAICAEQSIYTAVGVDIEKIRCFRDRTLRAFLTAGEQRHINNEVCKGKRDRVVTTIWCLKEAYLKALGTGLRLHPSCVAVQFMAAGHAIILGETVNQTVCANYFNCGQYIIATVCLPNSIQKSVKK